MLSWLPPAAHNVARKAISAFFSSSDRFSPNRWPDVLDPAEHVRIERLDEVGPVLLGDVERHLAAARLEVGPQPVEALLELGQPAPA